MNRPLRILSLGAGVQSSTLALMAAVGEIELLDCAIFADTQAEPASVYLWLDWLEKQLPFPVHRVTKGNLEQEALTIRRTRNGKSHMKSGLPVYVMYSKTGECGRLQMRTCTRDFKIVPVVKQLRKLAGIKRGQKDVAVIQWIGISFDEVQRMKPPREPWIRNCWPLVERRMTRQKCIAWMASKGYPTPPRSACYFCPFHSSDEWRRLQEDGTFDRAVRFEKNLQKMRALTTHIDNIPFLHRSCRPLDTIDFRSDVERGQMLLNGWQDECEGMCGV